MRPVSIAIAFLVGLATIISTTRPAQAQVTTATVRGRVLSGDDGTPMAGVSVTLVNLATGSTKVAVTEADGQYAFTGLEVGGPYQLDAELPGFKSFQASDIFLSAGKSRDIGVSMKVEEEVIKVESTSMTRNQSNRTVITSQDIADLPSITRDPRDLIRLSPDADVEGSTTSSPSLSIAGNNNRFNSITVDGIREDDDFGLNSSGYPTNRSPISLAAIQEMAVESAPFDVRYSKFMGGNVNIITKSGTNDWHGEIFGTYSSSGMMGTQTGDNKLDNNDFKEYRYGATLSGPIVKNKAHFIISVEGLQSTVPNDYGPAGSTALNQTQKVTEAEMQQVQQIAQQVYNFNAGIPNQDSHETDFKLFSKLDYQIDNQQRLVASYQRTAGTQDIISAGTSTELTLSSDDYNNAATLNAGAIRLYSDWTDRLSTQIEFDAKTVTTIPTPLNGNGFMEAEIKTPEGGEIFLGPDEFHQTNFLDNDVYHGKVELNYLSGINLVTAGAEYEILHIDNEFVPATFGFAEYSSIANFQSELPKQIEYENATDGNPADAAAKWNSGNIGLYIQDQLKVSDRFTVQGGLRLETYNLGDEITPNPTFFQHYGFWNTSTLNGRSILMPRAGASWLPQDDLNIHGGIGMYSGGSPTVWVSNAYSNDGVRLAEAFSNSSSVTSGFDGRNIPPALSQQLIAGTGEVDALDPHFRLPSLFKIGGGFDYSFLGATLKLFYTYSKTLEGVEWIDLRRNADFIANNQPIGTTQDGRAEYGPNFDTERGFDMLLTNTNQGFGHVFTASLQKTWPFGLTFAGTYAFEHVEDTTPANSSRSVSNYDNTAYIDPNTPLLALSDYNRANRFTASVVMRRPILHDITHSESLKKVNTTIGLFAEARSGQPYSWTFGDANFGSTLAQIFGTDASIASHDSELFFVPKNDSDVILNGITPQQFDAFLNATGLSKYRGEIAPRNAFESPWFNHVDMRFAQDIPTPWPNQRAQFFIDMTNVGNLLDPHWGRSEAAPFPFANPAVNVNIDPATGKYIYSNLASPNQYVVDLISSVWRISVGLQYNF
jgi:outer membrane receptor for ferrienterochelin and colicin